MDVNITFDAAAKEQRSVVFFPYKETTAEDEKAAIEEITTVLDALSETYMTPVASTEGIFIGVSSEASNALQSSSFASFDVMREATSEEVSAYRVSLGLEHGSEPHECQKAKTGKCCGQCSNPKP